jgi:hypothetical protein
MILGEPSGQETLLCVVNVGFEHSRLRLSSND